MIKNLPRSPEFPWELLDALPHQISVVTADDHVVFGNKAFRARDCRYCHQCQGTCLKVLETAKKLGGGYATSGDFKAGITRIFAGEIKEFALDYYCPRSENWIRAKAQVFEGEGPTRVLVAKEDITEKRKNLEELLKLKRAIEKSSSMIMITDDRGIIEYVNEKFTEVTGFAADEVIGKNPNVLKADAANTEAAREMWKTITAGEEWRGEFLNRRKNGDFYWESASISSVRNPAGRITHYIAVKEDITRKKQDELALQKAREQEVEIASHIQRTLLTGVVPDLEPLFSIACFAVPSLKVDGDFFDFFTFDQNRFDVIQGDVMGKGVRAALFGAGFKSRLMHVMALQLQELEKGALFEPQAMLQRLHQEITPTFEEMATFLSLGYLRFDASRQLLTYLSCGHPSIIMFRSRTNSWKTLDNENMPMGLMQDTVYRQSEMAIQPGDWFFLHTDGITDVKSPTGEFYGNDRFREFLRREAPRQSPATLVEACKKELFAFAAAPKLNDDVTLVVVRVGVQPV
jgi:PAS domain S-box-containing protein